MKNTILLAGLLALGVFTLFAALNLYAGLGPAERIERGKGAAGPNLVPPLARIVQAQDEAAKVAKETYHSKAAPPTIKIFQTLYKGGTQVTFDHTKHVNGYKLNCIECHHVERCDKCHLKSKTHTMEVAKGKQSFHEDCISCHSETRGPDDCLGCHKQ